MTDRYSCMRGTEYHRNIENLGVEVHAQIGTIMNMAVGTNRGRH